MTLPRCLMFCDKSENLLFGSQVFRSMPTRVLIIQMHSILQERFKYQRSRTCRSQHHTIVTRTVNILPMQPCLEQYLCHIQMIFETSPMQRVCFQLLCRSNWNVSVLRSDLKILLPSASGKQQLYYRSIP